MDMFNESYSSNLTWRVVQCERLILPESEFVLLGNAGSHSKKMNRILTLAWYHTRSARVAFFIQPN